MQVLRLILGLVIAVGVFFLGLFAFVAVAVVGVIALIVQTVRRRKSGGNAGTRRDPFRSQGREATEAGVIDIVATETPADRLR
jgi:hypothetical protein